MAVIAGRFDSAAEAYRGLVGRNPQDADAYIGLGDALEGMGRSGEAEAYYRKAIAVEPAYWGAHAALGSHLFQRGNIYEAAIALRKVAELVPSSANAWSNLGAALQMEGNFSKAVEAYNHSLQLEPSKDAYSNLATSYFYLGQFAEAVAHYERALALGEHDHLIQGNLGDALWQLEGRRNEAIAHYRRAILLTETELEARPADAALRAQLGYYYGRVGDADQSMRQLSEALATGPEMLYVQYFVGVSAADKGDRETALQAVSALVRLGFPLALLRSAPEFRSLLQDPDYKKIIGAS
jgi:superkiller protein 3